MIPFSYQQKRFHKHIWSWNHRVCVHLGQLIPSEKVQLTLVAPLVDASVYHFSIGTQTRTPRSFSWSRVKAHVFGWTEIPLLGNSWPRYNPQRKRERVGGFLRDSVHLATPLTWPRKCSCVKRWQSYVPKYIIARMILARAQEMPSVLPHNNDFSTSTVS